MNAQLILNRHPRVLRTVYFKALDDGHNLYDVAAEYGFTRATVKAFVDDFNRHGIDVPRPDGWQRINTTIMPDRPTSEVIGASAQDPNTPSLMLIEPRVTELERQVAELSRIVTSSL